MWKLKITPSAVFAYKCPERSLGRNFGFGTLEDLRDSPPDNDNRSENEDLKTQKNVFSDLSINSSRKMKRALQWLVACSPWKEVYEKRFQKLMKWRVNHIVLTFHENLKDDRLAREILSKWLEMAKYRFCLRQYVWKMETQERGAAHFHLSTNVYIPHQELRYTWNRALRKHKLANINDNSIDIHAVTEENDMISYFSDYLTDKEKGEGRRKVKGRIWASSHDLAIAGSNYIALQDDEVRVIEDDLQKYSLRDRLHSENKEIPDFLNFVNFWTVSPGNLKGPIFDLYQTELKTLKEQQSKFQLSFWERSNSAPYSP